MKKYFKIVQIVILILFQLALTNEKSYQNTYQNTYPGYPELPLVTESEFTELTRSDRKIAVLVFFTASTGGSYDCKPCPSALKSLEYFQKTWSQSEAAKTYDMEVVVSDVNFDPIVFKKAKVDRVPICHLYLPKNKKDKKDLLSPEVFLFENKDYIKSAEALTGWVSSKTGKSIRFTEPIDFNKIARIIGFSIISIIGIIIIISMRHQLAKFNLFWGIICSIIILIFNGGYMWVQIRTPEYQGKDEKGNPSYFMGGMQQQYGVEVMATSIISSSMASIVLLLIYIVPKIKDKRIRDISSIIMISLMIIIFSINVIIFDKKMGGYPFRMLF